MSALAADFTIRRATISDVAVLASLNVRAWQETYRGLLPDALLDASDFLVEREHTWLTVMKYARSFDAVFLLMDETHLPVGYASVGPAREADMGHKAELCTIYLLRQAQGRGWGRALWNVIVAHLNHEAFYLWSHSKNPSIGFYKRMGGKSIATRRSRWHETTYPETAFGFSATGTTML